jgi:hypothetical protein
VAAQAIYVGVAFACRPHAATQRYRTATSSATSHPCLRAGLIQPDQGMAASGDSGIRRSDQYRSQKLWRRSVLRRTTTDQPRCSTTFISTGSIAVPFSSRIRQCGFRRRLELEDKDRRRAMAPAQGEHNGNHHPEQPCENSYEQSGLATCRTGGPNRSPRTEGSETPSRLL